MSIFFHAFIGFIVGFVLHMILVRVLDGQSERDRFKDARIKELEDGLRKLKGHYDEAEREVDELQERLDNKEGAVMGHPSLGTKVREANERFNKACKERFGI